MPRFKEEVLADRLGEPLKGLQVPSQIVAQIVDALRDDQSKTVGKLAVERTRLESRITLIRNRMDAAYTNKLDGKFSGEFWHRRKSELLRECRKCNTPMEKALRCDL